jgi:hypothetical protein
LRNLHANKLQFKMAVGKYRQFTSELQDLCRAPFLMDGGKQWHVPVSSSKELIVGASYQRGQWLADIEATARTYQDCRSLRLFFGGSGVY